jgi:thymidylate synthase (FAD)
MSCQVANDHYLALLDSGVKAQIARSVLPNSLKTEIVMTTNMREWRHFISLRGSLAAHPQIRPLAYNVWEILMKHAPSLFEDLEPNEK